MKKVSKASSVIKNIKVLRLRDLIFPRVLCVKKTTKYERLKATGVVTSKYVEDVMLNVW